MSEGMANPDMDAKDEHCRPFNRITELLNEQTDLLAVRGEGFDHSASQNSLRTAPGIKALAYEDTKMNYEDTWKQTIEKM